MAKVWQLQAVLASVKTHMSAAAKDDHGCGFTYMALLFIFDDPGIQMARSQHAHALCRQRALELASTPCMLQGQQGFLFAVF